MARDVIDIVVNSLWTGIFICLGIASYVGLRNAVMLVRHKARRGWEKSTSPSRVVSRRFGIAYLLYGLVFVILKMSLPDGRDGWIAAVGYMLVLIHILVLRIVHERETLHANN